MDTFPESDRNQPIPVCCSREMTLLRSGRGGNCAIWLWRCSTCERFQNTMHRYDGQFFWVGAMGDAIFAEINRLIADAYSSND